MTCYTKDRDSLRGESYLTQFERQEDLSKLPEGHVIGSESDKEEEGMTSPGNHMSPDRDLTSDMLRVEKQQFSVARKTNCKSESAEK